jgi:membrane protein
MSAAVQRARVFFSQGIWEINPQGLNPAQRVLLRVGQLGSRVVRDFVADRCLLRASALTYTSLLSFIPLLALMFSMLKGLGVQNKLEPLIIEHIAVGSEEVITRVIEYINNTNVGRLGVFGLVFLIMTVLTLLSNIEESFNSIWYVRETRSLMRRFSDYFSVVILGPIFLLLAVSMTSALKTQAFVLQLREMAYVGVLIVFLFKVLPYMAMWAAFTFLYTFMPNIKVHLRAALVGGIFGGTLWQLTQWAYVNFQVGVSKYNAIYGTMAALPILMVWIYLSWVIVLLGLEVAYAWQNLRNLRQEALGGEANFASFELMSLTVVVLLAERFQRGEEPLEAQEIAAQLDMPPKLTRNILSNLVRLRILSEITLEGREEVCFQPGRAPDSTEVFSLLTQIEEDGADYSKLKRTPEREVVFGVAQRLQRAGIGELQGLTVKDLVDQLPDERPAQKDSSEN